MRVVSVFAVTVVCSVLLAAALLLVVPERAVAHEGAGYFTEAEALQSLSAIAATTERYRAPGLLRHRSTPQTRFTRHLPPLLLLLLDGHESPRGHARTTRRPG